MGVDSVSSDGDNGPAVAVTAIARERTPDPSIWRFTWSVTNRDEGPLRILDAWLPHGRFRCPKQEMIPSRDINPGAEERLALPVKAHEEPGTVAENCYVILTVMRGDEQWRIFARLRVTFDGNGAPDAETVLITTQPVGFSG